MPITQAKSKKNGHGNQARRNEFESERARPLWADTPPPPPPLPAKSWKNSPDTEGGIDSVRINRVFVFSGLNLEKM